MSDIAVVTGASRGIGLAIARELTKTHRVFNLSRTHAPDARIHSFETDVSDNEQVRRTFDYIRGVEGEPEILICCAGHVEPESFLKMDVRSWHRHIDVNLHGAYYCTRQFLKVGYSGKVLVFISSTSATRPAPDWSAYAASKAGVLSLGLTLSEETADLGVRVYPLALGRCATELRHILAPTEDPATIMQPETVARFVRSLVEDTDGLLDGQILRVRQS
jgi:NAD(P)-dependent dehydrogenase (short-subunit alcohol dehydrogenase family)